MIKTGAIANNGTVLIYTILDGAIDNCLGLSFARINAKTGERTVLPAHLPFPGQDNSKWDGHTTEQWPVQKPVWMDFGPTQGETYKYEVTPMVGTPDKLQPLVSQRVTTNEVTISTECGPFIDVAFNRGFLATQAISNAYPTAADGGPDLQKLVDDLKTPGHPTRKALSNGLIEFFMTPLREAKKIGGMSYEALYELTDPEVLAEMLADSDLLHLILGNTQPDDEENAPARKQLHASKAEVIDRMLTSAHIPHNKSAVVTDKKRVPKLVRASCANATPTGFCTQANTVALIKSTEVGQICLDYWDRLKLDKAQDAALRTANAKPNTPVVLSDGTKVTVWFSPNTTEQLKPKSNPATPPDMAQVFSLMDGAKQGIYFLAFFPGFPSIMTKIAAMSKTRHDLLLRGAVSSPQAMPYGGTTLYHRAGTPPVMVAASGIEKEFSKWLKETTLLPDSHAIIHDKLMVIDPLDPVNCKVIITSHNLGFKASYQNDETMWIFEGNQALALRVLVHILDVYNHYRFRALVNSGAKLSGTLGTDNSWMTKYVTPGGAHDEMVMWEALLPKKTKAA